MPHRHCPPALTTMGGMSAESFDSFTAPKLASLLLGLPSRPHHHLRQGCIVKLIQMSMGPLTHSQRERNTMLRSVTLTSLGIPSDSSKGTQQARIFIKVPTYETGWLFTVISKEPKFGLPVEKQPLMGTLLIQPLPLPSGQAFDKRGLTHSSFPLPACEFRASGYLDCPCRILEWTF